MKKFQQRAKNVRAVQFGRGQRDLKMICSCDAHEGPHIHRLGEKFGTPVAVAEGDWLVSVSGDRVFKVMSDKQFKDTYEEVPE